jgi:hypothetical protein
LVDSGEHFQKYLLGKVFLRDPAGQMGAGDADDEGVKVLDEVPCRVLISFSDAIKAAGQIKRLVFRHVRIEASSDIFCKTLVARPRLPCGDLLFLDFPRLPPMNQGRDGTRPPGPPTYPRARPLKDAA